MHASCKPLPLPSVEEGCRCADPLSGVAQERREDINTGRYERRHAREAVRTVDIALAHGYPLHEVVLASKRREISEERERSLDRDR